MSYEIKKSCKGEIEGFHNNLYNPGNNGGAQVMWAIEFAPEWGGVDHFYRKSDAQAVADWMNATGYVESDLPHFTCEEAYFDAVGYSGVPQGYQGKYGDQAQWKDHWSNQ